MQNCPRMLSILRRSATGTSTAVDRNCRICLFRLSILLFLLTLPTTASTSSTAAEAEQSDKPERKRPNIVFVLADDLGWTDLGCQGSEYYETPNIDRLSTQGVRLQRYHNCQNCQPTRAALMTGRYAARTGVYTVGSIDRFDWRSRPLRPVDNVTRLPLTEHTIAQALQTQGYATGMFGKWHLGEEGDYHPVKRGFDEAIVSMGRHVQFTTNPPIPHSEDEYLADFLTARATDFIQRHRDQPFFLYLSHFGVHSPYQAKEDWIRHFRSKPGVAGHHDAVYAAMIASVDESVGRIMQTLDDLQLTKSTVFIFSSDNGGVGGYASDGLRMGGITDNTPLRSGKGSLYEGGTRVPFIARWPGEFPAGSVCSVPAIHVDLFPTFLQLAGAETHKDLQLDGNSLLPLFRNPDTPGSDRCIFQHFPGYLGAGPGQFRTTPVSVIQCGDWKLMEFLEDQRLELYNLRDDIGERHNLAGTMPAKRTELHTLLTEWRTAVSAPMPARNSEQTDAPVPGNQKKKNPAKNGKKGTISRADAE